MFLDKSKTWQDLNTGAETGWDFSTRWFSDHTSTNLSNINTRQIIPVDLNAIIFWNMDILQFFYDLTGKKNRMGGEGMSR